MLYISLKITSRIRFRRQKFTSSPICKLPLLDPPFTPLDNQQPSNVLSAKYNVLGTGDTTLNKPDKTPALEEPTAVQR